MPGSCEEHFRAHSPERFDDALAWLAGRGLVPRRVCDLGCGTGVLLGLVAARFPEAELVGVDVAVPAVRAAAARTGCRTVAASILEPGLGGLVGAPFDLVVLGAVLHHVTGPTRRASRLRAVDALRNALGLLGAGGVVIVVEPTFAPRRVLTLLFWVKRVVAVTGRRVEIGRWNNIGAPVVSYFGPEELAAMIAAAGGTVEHAVHRRGRLRRLPRALGIRGRWESTFVVRSDPGPGRTAA